MAGRKTIQCRPNVTLPQLLERLIQEESWTKQITIYIDSRKSLVLLNNLILSATVSEYYRALMESGGNRIFICVWLQTMQNAKAALKRTKRLTQQ